MAYQDVEIITNLALPAITQATILAVLQHGTQQSVSRGEAFTGRQSTRIIHNDQYVIKLRFDFRLAPEIARRWVRTRVQQEEIYGVYHPSKTWFLWFINNVSRPVIANITPRMRPLHLLTDPADSEALFLGLSELFKQYFAVFAQQQSRLDEGLSNFAFHNHVLFYVDDDIYNWDEGVGLSAALATMLRTIAILAPPQWQALGEQVRITLTRLRLLDSILFFLKNELEAAPLAKEKEPLRQALLSGLTATAALKLKPLKKFALRDNKIAFFADIHANVSALSVVLNKLNELQIQQAIVLGDIVGYGFQASECIKELKNKDFLVIKGNHDHAAATDISMEQGYSQDARTTLSWTRQHLSLDEKAWLADLPSFFKFDQALAVHGAPMDRRFFYGYVYQMTYEENLAWLREHGYRFAFHGHSHVQGVYFQRGKESGFSNAPTQSLAAYAEALICPGSCGWPRDGRPGSQFCVFDRETFDITFYHLDYPYQPFLEGLSQQNFPENIALRLQTGR